MKHLGTIFVLFMFYGDTHLLGLDFAPIRFINLSGLTMPVSKIESAID